MQSVVAAGALSGQGPGTLGSLGVSLQGVYLAEAQGLFGGPQAKGCLGRGHSNLPCCGEGCSPCWRGLLAAWRVLVGPGEPLCDSQVQEAPGRVGGGDHEEGVPPTQLPCGESGTHPPRSG